MRAHAHTCAHARTSTAPPHPHPHAAAHLCVLFREAPHVVRKRAGRVDHHLCVHLGLLARGAVAAHRTHHLACLVLQRGGRARGLLSASVDSVSGEGVRAAHSVLQWIQLAGRACARLTQSISASVDSVSGEGVRTAHSVPLLTRCFSKFSASLLSTPSTLVRACMPWAAARRATTTAMPHPAAAGSGAPRCQAVHTHH